MHTLKPLQAQNESQVVWKSAHNFKNSEKDADFLRRGNFWYVRAMRGKTQLKMRIQEGLGPSNPRSTCMLDIEWKAANQTQILKAIEDLKRLVNERNLSLNGAKNC